MSNFKLSLNLQLVYNQPINLSFEAFAKNEQMKELGITKISETKEQLTVKFDNCTATFTKVNKKLDFDYEAFQKQADIFKGFEHFTFRHNAISESKDHSFYIDVKVEANEERAFLEIQNLFFAAMYQTDEEPPVGIHVPENKVLLSYGDYVEFAVNQITDWGLYLAWINFHAHIGKRKTTVYTQGLKKLGEKDLEFTVKNGKELDAHKFLLNLAMHSLTSTASYHDGDTTTNTTNGKDYEFTKKKSKFLDSKVLELEKY